MNRVLLFDHLWQPGAIEGIVRRKQRGRMVEFWMRLRLAAGLVCLGVLVLPVLPALGMQFQPIAVSTTITEVRDSPRPRSKARLNSSMVLARTAHAPRLSGSVPKISNTSAAVVRACAEHLAHWGLRSHESVEDSKPVESKLCA